MTSQSSSMFFARLFWQVCIVAGRYFDCLNIFQGIVHTLNSVGTVSALCYKQCHNADHAVLKSAWQVCTVVWKSRSDHLVIKIMFWNII